jgi:hypothetical protein
MSAASAVSTSVSSAAGVGVTAASYGNALLQWGIEKTVQTTGIRVPELRFLQSSSNDRKGDSGTEGDNDDGDLTLEEDGEGNTSSIADGTSTERGLQGLVNNEYMQFGLNKAQEYVQLGLNKAPEYMERLAGPEVTHKAQEYMQIGLNKAPEYMERLAGPEVANRAHEYMQIGLEKAPEYMERLAGPEVTAEVISRLEQTIRQIQAVAEQTQTSLRGASLRVEGGHRHPYENEDGKLDEKGEGADQLPGMQEESMGVLWSLDFCSCMNAKRGMALKDMLAQGGGVSSSPLSVTFPAMYLPYIFPGSLHNWMFLRNIRDRSYVDAISP